jgi:cobalt-zinc-cadmium efflux system protein
MHQHEHERRSTDRRALLVALLLILGLMVVEIAGGIVASSLALLADAAHMLTDAGALALALVAAHVATRPAAGRWTFGFGRVEILAAQVNGITLVLLGLWIVYSAVDRLISPPEVRGGLVLGVALVGVVVNLVATVVLTRASSESLNVRGALLHVATDLAAFVGTAVAGALILVTGWDRFDPLASLVVAGLMFWGGGSLLRDSTHIFLEASPAGLDPADVGRAIISEPEVVEAHDLHVWTVTSGFPALSAHVLVEQGADCHAVRERLQRLLATRFGVTHSTLQVDHAAQGAQPVELGVVFRRETPVDGH